MKITRLLSFIAFFSCANSFAQTFQAPSKLPLFSFNNGLGITSPDSSFGVAIRMRIQNRVGAILTENSDGNWELTESEFRARRVRLRFDGFVFNPKWTYALQLSFSRGDQDWDVSNVPNVLRDAMIFYKPNKHWLIGFGQGKLPGNRQRVVSSGEQQFTDRSIVNANLTIDRDFGVNASYSFNLGKPQFILRGAISGGEGRNEGLSGFNNVNPGLSYTGRMEILPFGIFDKRGDYSESDLAREQKPKLSIAAGYNYNEGSERTGGQLGRLLYSPLNLKNFISDFVLKYRGLSIYGEYIRRVSTTSPITNIISNGVIVQSRYIYQGEGALIQAGYLFKNNYEIAARYAQLNPFIEISAFEDIKKNYAICFSKYLKGHKLKLQTDFTFEEAFDALSKARSGRSLAWRFQIEMGL
jgi:phosphate-selective porin OprO/OprP